MRIEGRTSPLRVEINPWTLDGDLEEALLLRGAYIAAMGTIETNLTELAIRASKHPAYYGIRDRFPSRRPERIKYLQDVCERDGPLTQWRTLLKAVLARFNASLGDRDLFAHGRMQVLSGPGGTTVVQFGDFYAQGGVIEYRYEPMVPLSDLRRKAHKAARFSRATSLLYLQLGDTLPPASAQS